MGPGHSGISFMTCPPGISETYVLFVFLLFSFFVFLFRSHSKDNARPVNFFMDMEWQLHWKFTMIFIKVLFKMQG